MKQFFDSLSELWKLLILGLLQISLTFFAAYLYFYIGFFWAILLVVLGALLLMGYLVSFLDREILMIAMILSWSAGIISLSILQSVGTIGYNEPVKYAAIEDIPQMLRHDVFELEDAILNLKISGRYVSHVRSKIHELDVEHKVAALVSKNWQMGDPIPAWLADPENWDPNRPGAFRLSYEDSIPYKNAISDAISRSQVVDHPDSAILRWTPDPHAPRRVIIQRSLWVLFVMSTLWIVVVLVYRFILWGREKS